MKSGVLVGSLFLRLDAVLLGLLLGLEVGPAPTVILRLDLGPTS